MQHFDLPVIAPQPCGRLADSPPEPRDWRLSLALATADGPFSRVQGPGLN